MAESPEPDLTVAQFAAHKQVSPKTIRREIARGNIEARRVGPRLIRIPARELTAWGRPLQYTRGGDAA